MIIYSILVLTGKTYLPIWMAFINPFFLGVVVSSSRRWALSAIAGYLVPIGMYVSVIPLQVLTLIYVWNAV